MPITLITGVPGTGKTAFLVSELEKIAATGRTIFVDNISGLLIPHYRAGKIQDWQKGTWLHIDQYKRTSPSIVAGTLDDDNDDLDGNENWIPNSEVVKGDDGGLRRVAFDSFGSPVGFVPYESHKGALLVIDECQRHFRPRPAGSAVPDHVAALEVHRHQGLDIWLVTQRPGLVDSNVRALCGKHIALRKTPFGRYKYEWPEVGDIENKSSRDVAAKTRFKLPKHVFSLYKSAEVHTVTSHKLPMVAKVFLLCVPILGFLVYSSYSTISKKLNPQTQVVKSSQEPISDKAAFNNHLLSGKDTHASGLPPALIAAGFEPYNPKSDMHHPYEKSNFSIVAHLKSATRDLYRFSLSSDQGLVSYLSSDDLLASGYKISNKSDCSVKISYNAFSTFATCGTSSFSPAPALSASSNGPETIPSVPVGSRSYDNVVLAGPIEGTRY